MEFLKKLRNFIWSKHFLKHTGLIFLAYVVIVGGTIFILDSYTNHGQQIKVPNLIGLKSDIARQRVEELDLKLEKSPYGGSPAGREKFNYYKKRG